ncbi:MAG TPA: DNA translocase FtsK 4TM domain-containing protein, partial [Burkholderiaceae bacterium]|nr:DNA translocase FtsK 4TM domain-containing protein [Burkholderiaceae bacterium]
MRSRTAAPVAEGNGRLAQLLAEAGWIVGAVAAVALFAMLATFSSNDPAFTHTASAAGVENIGGRFGAWVADIALLLFGVSAYLVVFGLAITVVRGFRKLHRAASGDPLNDDLPAYAHGIGFVLLLFGAVGLEALRFHTLGVALPGSPGGVIGGAVARFLQAGVGFTGATVIMLVAIAIGFSLFLDFSWLAVAERFGGFIEGFSRRARRKREEAEDRAIGEAAAKVREAALSDERGRIEEAAPVHIERAAAHVKPSERKQKEKQVPLFADMADARLPPLDLLDEPPPNLEAIPTETLEFTSRLIEKKLRDFNVEAVVVAAYPGPVITRYEIEPAVGVKGSQIVNLAKDLARALSLVSIRVVETIPGKNLMGLELPNPRRQVVKLSEILGSVVYNESHSLLTLGLGKDISGKPVVVDLARMPHLLVAGTTGAGKSVGLNAMILSILYKAAPSQVRMILIDPKMLELSVYEGIPHLLAPVVTDMKLA